MMEGWGQGCTNFGQLSDCFAKEFVEIISHGVSALQRAYSL